MSLEEHAARIAPGLLRYCRSRFRDGALAEDVAQEALAALVARWHRHGPPDDPAAFAFGIARRRGARWARRQRFSQPLALIAGNRDPGPDPERRAQVRGEAAAMRRALGELPDADREALLLTAAGELDHASAAVVLGISRSALKMRLHRARRRLEKLLEDQHAGCTEPS